MKRKTQIVLIATLIVAALASFNVTKCYADGEDVPFTIFVGENTIPGPIVRSTNPGATPIWAEFDASIPAIMLHFQADLGAVLLKVDNMETGEQFSCVVKGKTGMVVPVFVSSRNGVFQITVVPCKPGVQADCRTKIY